MIKLKGNVKGERWRVRDKMARKKWKDEGQGTRVRAVRLIFQGCFSILNPMLVVAFMMSHGLISPKNPSK